MAKYIAQLIIAGTQIVGRAFARAIRQEIEASQQAAQRLGGAKSQTRAERLTNEKHGLSLDEAKQILNIDTATNELLSGDELTKRYETLFKANDKSGSGSLYIQSKIVRAKERIEHELLLQQQQQQGPPGSAKKAQEEERVK